MSEHSDPHIQNRLCALPEPYPKPKVITPNRYYAQLLLEDYSGPTSELTSVNQYLFHHFTFLNLKDLAELERCISIIEMKHMELLAETILLLGVTPEFRILTSNIPVYWTASYVYYGTDICDKLAADIASEIQAIENYRLHQRLIDDICIKQMLERIIQDEEHHLKLFRDIRAKYCRS